MKIYSLLKHMMKKIYILFHQKFKILYAFIFRNLKFMNSNNCHDIKDNFFSWVEKNTVLHNMVTSVSCFVFQGSNRTY